MSAHPTPPIPPEQRPEPFVFQAKSFALLLVVNFFFFMSFSLYFLLPRFIKSVGGSEDDIGQIMFLGGIASLITIPQIGKLIDRHGRRPFLLLGAVCMVVGNFGYLLVDHVGPLIYVVRMLQGAAFAAVFTTAATMAADLLDPMRRSWGIGIFGVATLITHAIGPAIAEPLVNRWGYTPLFLVGGMLAATALILGTRLPEPAKAALHAEHVGVPQPSFMTVMRRYSLFYPTLLAGSCGAGFGSVIQYLPTYGDQLGLSNVSPFFVSYALVAVFLRLTTGNLPDRYGKQRFIIPCAIGYVFAILGTSFLVTTTQLVILGIALGMFHGMLYPVLNALVVDRVEGTGALGKAMSLYVFAFNAGVTFMTLASGYVAEYLGYRAMFRTSALVTAVGVALYILNELRMRRGSAAIAGA